MSSSPSYIPRILTLPRELIVFMVDFLYMEDFCMLDSAMCSRKYRGLFLSAFLADRGCIFHGRLRFESGALEQEHFDVMERDCTDYIRWLELRDVRVRRLRVKTKYSVTYRNDTQKTWCSEFEDLDVSGCVYAAIESMAHSSVANLKSLSLSGCGGITNENIVSLTSRATHLSALNVGGLSHITDDTVIQIARHCPKLRQLKLANCRLITDDAISGVAEHCSFLESIDLTRCQKITDVSLIRLSSACPKMTSIQLFYCFLVSDKGLAYLAQHCSGLTEIDISFCLQCHDEGLFAMAEGFRSLQHFRAVGQHQFSERALVALVDKNGSTLRSLKLAECVNLTDWTITYAVHTCGPRLQQLDLSSCSLITDGALQHIARFCMTLQYLNLCGCVNVSDEAMAKVAHSCNDLRFIDLNFCKKIADATVISIIRCCPKIRYVNIYKCLRVSVDVKQQLKKCLARNQGIAIL